MKPSLYLHIGSPKTGTSALQAFFSLNANILKSKGINYPNPQGFSQEFQTSSGNGNFLRQLSTESNHNSVDTILTNALLASQQNILLFSSELLFFMNSEEWLGLKSDKYNIKIILYLRNQYDFIHSAILQLIKNHNYTKLTYPESQKAKLWYSKKIKSLSEVFGKENIIIRIYEKQQFVGGSIFSDFLSILNLELTDEYTMPQKIVNPSLNRDYAELKRILNTLPFDEIQLRKTFLNSLWKLSVDENEGESLVYNILSPQERLTIATEFAEDNEKVARKYLGRKDGRLFYDSLPDPDEPWKAYPGLPIEIVIKSFGYIYVNQYNKIEKQQKQIKQMQDQLQSIRAVVMKHLLRGARSIFSLDQIEKIQTTNCKMCTVAQENNILLVISTGGDPYFIIPNRIPFVSENFSYFVQIEIHAPCDTTLQFFYRDVDGIFDGKQSIEHPLNSGKNNIQLQLDNISKNKFVRLDPGCHPGVYKITKFEIWATPHI